MELVKLSHFQQTVLAAQGTHIVAYDDGDTQEHNLDEETWSLLPSGKGADAAAGALHHRLPVNACLCISAQS